MNQKINNLLNDKQEPVKDTQIISQNLTVNRSIIRIKYKEIDNHMKEFSKNLIPFFDFHDYLPRTTETWQESYYQIDKDTPLRNKIIEELKTTEENKVKEYTACILELEAWHIQSIREQFPNREIVFDENYKTRAIGHIINAIFKTADHIYQTYPLQKEEEICIK